MDIPVLTANPKHLRRLMEFIYTYESTLTEFGALKIQITTDCELALKQSKPIYTRTKEQNVRKFDDNELIYSINKDQYARSVPDQIHLPITSEESFWSALSHPNACSFRTDVTIYPKKSFFYEKLNRKYFSMWHIPGQSLLQLLSCNTRKRFLPQAALAHGPGAIFPLATTKYSLSSLVYHHNGGARQWYIIPAYEREALRKLFEDNHYIERSHHDTLLIDPSVLDRYQIRYHRLVQYPNELVVLACGVITQSFVTDTCWSESCMFALPSWIRDGHAFADQSLFVNQGNYDSSTDVIDLSIFTEKSIEDYINDNLVNPNIVEMPRVPTDSVFPVSPSFIETLIPSFLTEDTDCSSMSDRQNQEVLLTSSTTQNIISESEQTSGDMFNNLSIESIYQASLDESIYTLVNQNDKLEEHDLNTTTYESTNVIVDELRSLCELFSDKSGRSQDIPITGLSPDLLMNIQDEISNQEFMDAQLILPSRKQDKTHHRSKTRPKENVHRTLFVSGLRKNITKNDLYKYFSGSINVTLKSSHSGEPFQYAFILHRTPEQARRNLRIPIDRTYLGSGCSIVLAQEKKSSCFPPTSYRFWNDKTLVITKIPLTATANDLQQVFTNSHIIKYCSAHSAHRPRRSKLNSTEKGMILTGYAFISFDTKEEVSHVLAHAAEYRIHEQPLTISMHRGNQSP